MKDEGTEQEICLRLLPSADDPPLGSPQYQKDLRGFHSKMKSAGVNVTPRSYAFDGVGGGGGYSEEFVILVAALAQSASVIVGAWLHAKYGRNLSVKFGDIEAKASAFEELKKALQLIEQSQQRNKGRIIHDR